MSSTWYGKLLQYVYEMVNSSEKMTVLKLDSEKVK